jgi:hypothetical protein
MTRVSKLHFQKYCVGHRGRARPKARASQSQLGSGAAREAGLGSPEIAEVLSGQVAAHLAEGLQPGPRLLQAEEGERPVSQPGAIARASSSPLPLTPSPNFLTWLPSSSHHRGQTSSGALAVPGDRT